MKYQFKNLLASAIKDWPVEIDILDIQLNINSGRHTVSGLGIISDKISERYIGKTEEVIFRSLHQSIYTALHGAAPYVIKIKIKDIRPDRIKSYFENHLRQGMKNVDIGYSKEDIEICNLYFDMNQKI